MQKLPITECLPDGAGSVNSGVAGQFSPIKDYVPPADICIGSFDLIDCQDLYQEQIAAENLNVSGAPINVFKLLGIHEQGKLIDLVGQGTALNGSGVVFDSLASNLVTAETGLSVLTTPSWVGYDFGTVKTSYGQEAYGPPAPNAQHITTLRITQPTAGRRALQIRVERSTGGYKVNPLNVLYTGVGNGSVSAYTPGPGAVPGTLMLTATSPTSFVVFFTGDTTAVVGVCTVGTRFNSLYGSFTILPGSTPFASGDMFSVPIELDWYRVDVINLPDTPASTTVSIKQSSASRYWRVVPTSFSGATADEPWEVQRLELFDYQQTSLDNIQDQLFLENRDRDYAKSSVMFRTSYQPFDSVSDLSKFGFQISDSYTFTTVFSTMVKALGRPIVVGDVIELPSALQYDHNLKPVRKFLEVTETGWASDGYTTSWRPITFRFQATQLIPSQEHRDLLGTVDTQKYVVDDGNFFAGVQQIQTGPLTSTESINAEANAAVPEKGEQSREQASGTNRFRQPGSYDGVGLYVEDGLPPDGAPYTEGYKLPDVGTATDGQYFRLNYDPKLNIAARLYKFSAVKNTFIYVETDRRAERNSMKPSQIEVMSQPQTLSLNSKKIT
jgi:hypothetical protein